jgi:hypothetical protein
MALASSGLLRVHRTTHTGHTQDNDCTMPGQSGHQCCSTLAHSKGRAARIAPSMRLRAPSHCAHDRRPYTRAGLVPPALLLVQGLHTCVGARAVALRRHLGRATSRGAEPSNSALCQHTVVQYTCAAAANILRSVQWRPRACARRAWVRAVKAVLTATEDDEYV